MKPYHSYQRKLKNYVTSKVRNRFLILVLIIKFNLMEAQQGKYCAEDFMWSKCYTFLSENRFESEELMCVAMIVGKGHFEVRNDSLILDYEPIEYFDHNFSMIKDETKKCDNIQLEFEIIDFQSQAPIDTAKLSIFEESYTLIGKNKEFTIDNFQSPIFISVYVENHSSQNIILTENGNYKIHLELMDNVHRDSYDHARGTESYKMQHLGKDTLLLLNENNWEYLKWIKTNKNP